MTSEENRPKSPKLIHVVQGEFYVSDDAEVILSTILGSCVAACINDQKANVGGMNHFLLPDGEGSDSELSVRYGSNSMELLINGLLKLGARRDRLQAKLFGGAQMNNNGFKIGERNSKFARDFLNREGITCISESLGGTNARRLRYCPTTGGAQQKFVNEFVGSESSAVPKANQAQQVALF